ncbi:hypothetical protein V22_20010 [Calycomorphotria hydatis]|uniref:Uncharacterized protein n=1 Tax=Calycomorphotria hydatis TaxID=2528027 RepID=A0A517T8P8_9PLAN|nr:hypothetical protein V22_20010 [Calycomorphotria hydatis]
MLSCGNVSHDEITLDHVGAGANLAGSRGRVDKADHLGDILQPFVISE